MAQAPKPMGVMDRSELPSGFVFMIALSMLRVTFLEKPADADRHSQLLLNAPAVPNRGMGNGR